MRFATKSVKEILALAVVVSTIAFTSAYAEDGYAPTDLRQSVIEQSDFIQIPGPNPAISPGKEGAWDDKVLEASDAFEHLGTYYFYYHGIGAKGRGYQVGVATAPSPLGPFTKYGDKPILEVGPKDSWDERHVACAMIMRVEDEEDETFYMWYSGYSEKSLWSIGLATADNPLGPWTKHKDNPVIRDFGYLGGVVKIDGMYRLYVAHPINQPGDPGDNWNTRSPGYHSDYSPLAVAISDKPEGPFKQSKKNPLMIQGDTGDWDDGGISEAEVLYNNGMFHMFYGAVRTYGPRIESVGYAYSFDGFKWYKYGKNPVAALRETPGAAAYAEVHAIIEQPYIYLYTTLRPKRNEGRDYPWDEELGIQVLATQTPFSLEMPVMSLNSLEAGKKTELSDCVPLSLGKSKSSALTVECAYGEKANKPLQVRVYTSTNGLDYDSVPLQVFNVSFKAGETRRKTVDLNTNARFVKIVLINRDESQAVSDVKATASLNG